VLTSPVSLPWHRSGASRWPLAAGAPSLLLLVLAASPLARAQPAPTFFAPLQLDRDFVKQQDELRDRLSSRMVGTGRHAETVTAATAEAVNVCVRQVNSETNEESCWVRLGQGQGAKLLVTGKVTGTARSCSVVLSLTELETRITARKHFQKLTPCGAAELEAEIEQGARVLAGVAPAAVAPGVSASLGTPATSPAAALPPVSALPPPPPAASAGPVISSGTRKAAVGNLVLEVKPFRAVRLELTDPAGQRLVSGSPYRNAAAAVGSWRVKASGAGLEPEERSFPVPPDETTLVKLELVPLGGLAITGPEGADVAVTGPGGFANQGALPWAAQGLQRGAYEVQVSRTGYAELRRSVEVRPGETATLRADLQKVVTGGGGPGGTAGLWGLQWVPLPGGSFRMGSDEGDDDEMPAHSVTLRPFSLTMTEITVGQYRACVQVGKCTEPSQGDSCNWGQGGREDHPMDCIDWNQADAFCRAAGGRLPTEAEWEYAARSGGRDQQYPWGDEPASCQRAVMDDGGRSCGRGNTTWPVCSKPAGNSAQGLCDLVGNVWEWVADWYGSYSAEAVSDPVGPGSGSRRVDRGGSWGSPARDLRAAYRLRDEPAYRDDHLGARCAR